jgi:hypothetical protein
MQLIKIEKFKLYPLVQEFFFTYIEIIDFLNESIFRANMVIWDTPNLFNNPLIKESKIDFPKNPVPPMINAFIFKWILLQ